MGPIVIKTTTTETFYLRKIQIVTNGLHYLLSKMKNLNYDQYLGSKKNNVGLNIYFHFYFFGRSKMNIKKENLMTYLNHH